MQEDKKLRMFGMCLPVFVYTRYVMAVRVSDLAWKCKWFDFAHTPLVKLFTTSSNAQKVSVVYVGT